LHIFLFVKAYRICLRSVRQLERTA